MDIYHYSLSSVTKPIIYLSLLIPGVCSPTNLTNMNNRGLDSNDQMSITIKKVIIGVVFFAFIYCGGCLGLGTTSPPERCS